jgi:succinylglutamic semialdehyde dehydrogenase
MISSFETAGRCSIDGKWVEGNGSRWTRTSPADGNIVWHGHWSDNKQIENAIRSGQSALDDWASLSVDDRAGYCRQFAEYVSTQKESLARLIATETGKPLWEARTEVGSVVAKVSHSIDAIRQRCATTFESSDEFIAATRYRPLGTMLVLGPYNLPAHLPGSHIVPALLAGNTIVFKPSEWTPAVGQWLVEAWEHSDLPKGVLNLVHGGADVAIAAASNNAIAGVLFTGSHRAGVSLHRLLAGKPEKLLALEMGGNNPLVIHGTTDYSAASITTILSAFLTSGQRCTCSRRLIVSGEAAYQAMMDQLIRMVPRIQVGLPFDEKQPFMGPMIHELAAEKMLEAQTQLANRGAKIVIGMQRNTPCMALLTPGVIAVEAAALDDTEHFGPMLLLQRAADLDHAISLANQTRFGLAAGFLGESENDFQYFLKRIRAGVVNWNRPTTGASGRLSFGGIGVSGNHRPSGFFAADYCSYPIASMESTDLRESRKPIPGLERLG